MRQFVIALLLGLAPIQSVGVIGVSEVQAASGHYQHSQTIFRENPKYKYKVDVIQLDDRGGFLGLGKKPYWLVKVEGLSNDPGYPASENQFDVAREYNRRPQWEDLNRIVDDLHKNVRAAQSERDWDQIDQAELARRVAEKEKELAEMKAKQLAAEAEKLRKEQEKNKPKIEAAQ